MKRLLLLLTMIVFAGMTAVNAASNNGKAGTFESGNKTFLLNGKPFVVKAAELHYPRIPRPYWEHRIKMCKALGMNTICLYVFWNIHEQKEGEFDFTGQNDVAAFCRLAQKNGMYIIVRPGPYVCAEWEMGGLPWWLLKKKDIQLREQDPYFMERVEIFEREVGKQLSSLTIDNGGPIIMVQVENEYGSYGENKPYVAAIRDIVRKSGFDKVALFQCDWSSNFTKNGLDDLVWTMNFGTGANIDSQFKHLGELRPESPRMCSEYWSGWFDKWGARHETRPAKAMVDGIDEMLSKGISFSLYMTHGGTSFGHWAGANSPGFYPDVTSYDYDAPINEQGLATEKYYELRKMMAKYSNNKLPSVPKPVMPSITIPEVTLNTFAPITCGIAKTETGKIKTFEELDLGWGCMIYEADIPQVKANSILTINGCHDYARVFINGKHVGSINRINNETSISLPATQGKCHITILIEAMGRINFGRAIKDFKGITGDVTITNENDNYKETIQLTKMTQSTIPDDYDRARQAIVSHAHGGNAARLGNAGYYHGEFMLKKVGDTYLNMEAFGKGQVYVNGHAIGRFWHIGPQQTLFVPGCWLKKGKNEVIVLDIIGPTGSPVVSGLATPQLDKQLPNRDKSVQTTNDKVSIGNRTAIASGEFALITGWQKISFGKKTKGRYLAVACQSTHNKAVAAISEIYANDGSGKRINRDNWKTVYVSSEDAEGGNHTADKIIDLQESTFWRAKGNHKGNQVVIFDMGSEMTVSGIECLPCAEQDTKATVKGYSIYVF